MQFKLFALAAAFFSVVSPVLAVTSDELGIDIDTSTTATIDASKAVKSITTSNIVTAAPALLLVLRSVVEGGQALVFDIVENLLANPQQIFEPSGQLSICNNYKGLIRVQEQLVYDLIDKHPLLGGGAFVLPIIATIRALDVALGAFATGLSVLVPTCAPGFVQSTQRLSAAFDLAISTYSSTSS